MVVLSGQTISNVHFLCCLFPDNIGVIQCNYYCMHALIDAVCMYNCNWHLTIIIGTKLVSVSNFTSMFAFCPCSAFPLTQLLWYIVTWKCWYCPSQWNILEIRYFWNIYKSNACCHLPGTFIVMYSCHGSYIQAISNNTASTEIVSTQWDVSNIGCFWI